MKPTDPVAPAAPMPGAPTEPVAPVAPEEKSPTDDLDIPAFLRNRK